MWMLQEDRRDSPVLGAELDFICTALTLRMSVSEEKKKMN